MGMIRMNKQGKQASSNENKQEKQAEKRPVGRGWSFYDGMYFMALGYLVGISEDRKKESGSLSSHKSWNN